MKWTLTQGSWYNDEGSSGTPPGLPTNNPKTKKPWKDYDRYDDGVVVAKAPDGYTKVTNAYGQSVWLSDASFYYLPNGGDQSIARDHLIQGAHGDSGWHTSKGETEFYYLHPGKQGRPELYLLDVRVGEPVDTHTDGIPMVGVTCEGKVNGGAHNF